MISCSREEASQNSPSGLAKAQHNRICRGWREVQTREAQSVPSFTSREQDMEVFPVLEWYVQHYAMAEP
jgi:hypothetical protein